MLGRKFVVQSDHAALTYLHSSKELIGQQACCLDFMQEFTFDLQHRAGTSHGNADALSRKHSPSDLSGKSSCTQCRKRGMIREDLGEIIAACQDAKRPCGGNDSSAHGFVHAVLTRAQKRKKVQSPVLSDQDS